MVRVGGQCLVNAFQIGIEAELEENINTEEKYQILRFEAKRNENFYKDCMTNI